MARRPLGVESLEGRRLLSASPGTKFEAIAWQGRTVDVIDDQYVLRMRSTGRGANAFDYRHDAPVVPAGWSATAIGFGVYRLNAPGTTVQQVQTWGRAAGALYVEPQPVYRTQQVRPNDPGYPDVQPVGSPFPVGGLWGLRKIGMETAWTQSRGSADVVVAVIDTGIDVTHPDLRPNLWVNRGEVPGNGVDDDANGYVDDVNGWNAFLNNGDLTDTDGHGTHVAGTIAAAGNNGIGVVGVGWSTKVMAINVQVPGFGFLVGVEDAVAYALEQKLAGVNVVAMNASLGGGPSSQAMIDLLRLANTAGITFVAAAGNGGFDGIGDDNDITPHYPSSYDVPNVIAVAASTNVDGDQLALFSNYGARTVDIAAPGANILSTWPLALSTTGYEVISGTSMAAPHVAGAVAILKAINPAATVAQVRAALFNSVDKSRFLDGSFLPVDAISTGGRMNVARAIEYIRSGRNAPPVPNPPPFTGTPDISITAASVAEGHVGLRPLTFTISVHRATQTGTRVRYATADGTGRAGVDYNAASGVAHILPGQTTTTVTVMVRGDRVREAHETFTVTLSNPVNGRIVSGLATGTIFDDDRRSGGIALTATTATAAGSAPAAPRSAKTAASRPAQPASDTAARARLAAAAAQAASVSAPNTAGSAPEAVSAPRQRPRAMVRV